jgi:hypothetical protein
MRIRVIVLEQDQIVCNSVVQYGRNNEKTYAGAIYLFFSAKEQRQVGSTKNSLLFFFVRVLFFLGEACVFSFESSIIQD